LGADPTKEFFNSNSLYRSLSQTEIGGGILRYCQQRPQGNFPRRNGVNASAGAIVKDILQKSVPVAVLLVILILLLVFHALPPKHSTGFFVALAPARCPAEDDSDVGRLLILRITNGGTLYINTEQEQWNTLETRLSEIYSPRVYRNLYFSAEHDVPFQTVADAIDIAQNTHFGMPTQNRPNAENPRITIKLITPATMNAPCAKPVVVSGKQHSSR
jgi:biopolymer transport protein ExbD